MDNFVDNNQDQELLQIFAAEADDLFKSAEEGLLRLEVNPESGPDVEEVFRAIHTMKSSSAMVGFNVISEHCHLIEDLLDRLRKNELSVTKPLISFFLEDLDVIHSMVNRCMAGDLRAVDPDLLDTFQMQVKSFLGGGTMSPAESAESLEEKLFKEKPFEEKPKEFTDKQPEFSKNQGRVEQKPLPAVSCEQGEGRKASQKKSIRVEVEKLNHLINLAEEIGPGISRVQSLIGTKMRLQDDELEQKLENLVRLNREFQERISHLRMFPLEETFRRFQRMARDTACDQKKQIRVILTGAEEELDREVIEYITDPLKHLVRNCVDHGMEPPEERIAKGKPAEGTIEFKAFRQGGKIFIQISDDGRGFDIERIHRRAMEMGLAQPGDVFNQESLMAFVCTPGFSMASRVTELSGRGVGMDVVKTQVNRVGGYLKIDTIPGRGSTFTMALPLTFTLTEVLHIRSQDISYLVPVLGIIATEKLEKRRVVTIGVMERMYLFNGQYLPLADLSRISGGSVPERTQPKTVVIFLDTGRRRFGILVDEILDPLHVVVKSLETNYRRVKGIAGATIMGDGSVALVLDLLSLEDVFFFPNKE